MGVIDYRPQLDGLRALAVLAVALSHFAAKPLVSTVLPLGGFGVWLFFVLSGYLITGILLGLKAPAQQAATSGLPSALRSFYVRRALRIIPAYLATITVFLVLPGVADAGLGWHLTYTTNVWAALQDTTQLPGGHFWTLAVEEQFYLAWPALILLTPWRNLRRVCWLAVVCAPVFRWAWAWVTAGNIGFHTLPFGCLDLLAAGALVAIHERERGPARASLGWSSLAWILGTGAFGLGTWVAGRHEPGVAALVPACWAFAAARLVARSAAGLGGPAGWLLGLAPVRYLGRISYGIYLLHLFVPSLLWRVLSYDRVGALAGGALLADLLATVLLASVSWYLLERPILGLKRYFAYRPTMAHQALAETSPPSAPGGGRCS